MKQSLTLILAFALPFICRAQGHSKIKVTIPYDNILKKYCYSDFKKDALSQASNLHDAEKWAKQHLNSAQKTGISTITGDGSFDIADRIKAGIVNVNHSFTIKYNLSVIANDRGYKYLLTNIFVLQKGALVKTRLSLEEFVRQYTSQNMLNEDVVTAVSKNLDELDAHFKQIIASLGAAF